MAEEKKEKVIDAEATETDKKETKEKKSILKKVVKVAGESKPILWKGIKFIGKMALGTVTVLSTIGLIAAAAPTKKYYTPTPKSDDGNTASTGNSESETYHGEVIDE